MSNDSKPQRVVLVTGGMRLFGTGRMLFVADQ